MANFGPLQNPNPSTDREKIVTVDYVRETNRYANLGANSSTVGLLGKWVKYNVNIFTYIGPIPFFGEQPTA